MLRRVGREFSSGVESKNIEFKFKLSERQAGGSITRRDEYLNEMMSK